MTTFAPSRTIRFAVASPNPLVPPVMRAILPESFVSIVSFRVFCDGGFEPVSYRMDFMVSSVERTAFAMNP